MNAVGDVPRRDIILRPASRIFIYASLLGLLLLDLLPWGSRLPVPDWVALGLVFWHVHQPRKLGLGAAFALGLVMDVHDGALLGQHALSYTLLSYGAIALHRRVQWFNQFGQMIHVLPLLLIGQLVMLVVRLAAGANFPGFAYFAASLVATLLWPVAKLLLLAPQRRAVDRDENRPL
ncbi:rod shape-determining protein MreD [Derxia gummosa]|uniref:Rod shape-determining protein MreD n=1 Tax=Derxia gummosa DSM 723 TaxID=1121388 RepID=A0A8B6X8A4_9BURK|nr:rod shape-determining protein MreD [Derxia gummosa]